MIKKIDVLEMIDDRISRLKISYVCHRSMHNESLCQSYMDAMEELEIMRSNILELEPEDV